MLKQRVLTALVLAPLAIWGILALPSHWLGLVFAFVMLIGAWEWTTLQSCKSSLGRGLFVALIAAAIGLSFYLYQASPSFVPVLYAVACLWWLAALVWIVRYQGGHGVSDAQRSTGMLIGLIVLVPTWLGLVTIHHHSANGPYLLLYVMLLIWAADTGAYFAGRKWGKHKLAPVVSPGKTIEGAVGAMAASLAVALVGAAVFDLAVAELLWFLPLSLLVVIFSIVGDLAESLFKRRVGVKDSGSILPGHGGVLDRIDSLTSALPIFALGLMIFGEGI